MVKFLSWDCANRSLAFAVVSVDLSAEAQLAKIMVDFNELLTRHGKNSLTVDQFWDQSVDFFHDLDAIMSAICKIEVLTVHRVGCVDVIGAPLSEVSEIDRAVLMRKYLDKEWGNVEEGVITLIEHQPAKVGRAVNVVSTAVAAQLALWFAHRSPQYIDPKLKNNISFEDIKFITYKEIVDKKVTSGKLKSRQSGMYSARKKHSTDLFLRFSKVFRFEERLIGIKKGNMDDVADAFNQVLAAIRK